MMNYYSTLPLTYPPKLRTLPWYIWEEIIDYVIDLDNIELLKVSRGWYMRKASEYLRIYIPALRINKSTKPVIPLKHPVNSIIFERFTKVDWKNIYRCPNINTAEVRFHYGTKFRNYAIFIKKFESVNIEHFILKGDEFFSAYCFHIRFIDHFNLNLKSLTLKMRVLNKEDYDSLLQNLSFPKLTTFVFEGDGAQIPFNKIAANMPNLQSLRFKLSFKQATLLDVAIKCPHLQELELVDTKEFDTSVSFKLVLSDFPKLKKLTLLEDGVIEYTEGYFSQVEELTLYSPKPHLANSLIGRFPKLKLVKLDCSRLKPDTWAYLPQLLGSATHLILTGNFTTEFIKPVSHGTPYITSITLDEVPLTETLFVWLFRSFKFEYLHIKFNPTYFQPTCRRIIFPFLKLVVLNRRLMDPYIFYQCFFITDQSTITSNIGY